MTDEPLLWVGTLACALLTAAGLAPLERRTRLWSLAGALLLAPALIAADNWQGERLSELRDTPLLLVAAGVGAVLLVGALAAVFRRRPLLLPLATIAALPFRVPIDLAGSTANLLLPLYAVLAAGLVSLLVAEARGGRPSRSSEPGIGRWVGWALAAFVALYGLQSAYADDLSGAVENVAFFFAPFAILFLIVAETSWDRRTVRLAAAVLIAEALVFAAVGFGQYAARELFWNEKVIAGNEAHAWFRVNSLFWDPNILGRYLAVTMLLLAAVVAWAARPRPALLAAGAFLVLLAGLAITFSQTGMIALLGGIVVLVLVRWGPARAALALAAVVVAMGAAALATETDGPGGGTSGRTGLVSGGLELAADRPLAGYGSGSFASEFKQRFGGGDGIAVASHTEPVTVAAEQGAIGLLAYGALLATALAALALAAGVGRGPGGTPFAAFSLAALTLMFVHSLGYAAFFTDPISWALLALAAALPAAATLPVREVVGTAAA